MIQTILMFFVAVCNAVFIWNLQDEIYQDASDVWWLIICGLSMLLISVWSASVIKRRGVGILLPICAALFVVQYGLNQYADWNAKRWMGEAVTDDRAQNAIDAVYAYYKDPRHKADYEEGKQRYLDAYRAGNLRDPKVENDPLIRKYLSADSILGYEQRMKRREEGKSTERQLKDLATGVTVYSTAMAADYVVGAGVKILGWRKQGRTIQKAATKSFKMVNGKMVGKVARIMGKKAATKLAGRALTRGVLMVFGGPVGWAANIALMAYDAYDIYQTARQAYDDNASSVAMAKTITGQEY